jgi:hypothetical protein
MVEMAEFSETEIEDSDCNQRWKKIQPLADLIFWTPSL